jgi:hypothetical protein
MTASTLSNTMAANQDDTSNQVHNSTVRGLSRVKRYFKDMLLSASKKTPKRSQSSSSNGTSSKTPHRISSSSLHGGSSESHIGLPRKQNDSVYFVNGLQKLLPVTHERLLSSAPKNQTYRQAGIPPFVHGGSGKLAVGCTMTSPYDPGNIALSSPMSNLHRGGPNSSKATDAQGVGRSGQCFLAGSTKATPHNSPAQGLRQESQSGSYATSDASVTSVPQPWLDGIFTARVPQPGGGSKTEPPAVCPPSRIIVQRHVLIMIKAFAGILATSSTICETTSDFPSGTPIFTTSAFP